MRKTKHLFLLLLSTIFLISFVFNGELVEKLMKGLMGKTQLTPQEKIYLTSDRQHYILNDTLWFSAWLTDAFDHSKDPISQLLYVQLTDNDDNILKKINIPIFEKNGSGYIPLNIEWKDHYNGKFKLQAYTSNMLNYDRGYVFSRDIAIWTVDFIEKQNTDQVEKIENIQFFPEGGNIIAGISNNIAFEVKSTNNSSNLNIIIVDDKGKTITTIRPIHNGMGFFTLKPEKGRKLSALLSDQKIDLPEIQETGFNLLVTNRGSESIKILAQSNVPQGLSGCFIMCHQKGESIAVSQPMIGDVMAFRVNKSELKDGVAQITLFDKSGVPLAERAIFIYHNEDQINVTFDQNYEYYIPRTKVELGIKLSSTDTFDILGQYCVSVVDLNEINHHAENLDIKSYFLLNSEMTREISNPGYYFKDFDSKKNALLDLLMMVHGWTRIKTNDLLQEKEINLEFPPERGVTISGRVVDKSGKGLNRAKVDLSILDLKIPYVDQASCTKNGKFTFFDVPILKDQVAFLKAYEEEPGRRKNSKPNINEKVIIQLDDNDKIQATSYNASSIVWNGDFKPNKFLKSALEKQRDDSSYADIKITLDEIEITSFRDAQQAKIEKDRKLQKERGMAYAMYDSRIWMDSLSSVNVNWTIMDFVANYTPGARLVRNAPNPPTITFRNKRANPAYFIDGFPVDPNAIVNIDINTVQFIDVLRSSMSAVAFGDVAYGGAVLVYTYPPGHQKFEDTDDPTAKNVAKYIGEGFIEAREFYSPDYSKKGPRVPDNRTTLYWTPLKNTDAAGKSTMSFYTCDKQSTYLVKVEGMSKDGRPFVGYHTFAVK
jgi:hypothetical protein